jgi:hypothetical protein
MNDEQQEPIPMSRWDSGFDQSIGNGRTISCTVNRTIVSTSTFDVQHGDLKSLLALLSARL